MISKIEMRNFRNKRAFKYDITKSILIIEGDNGVGKTSLLEAIYFASTTKSHRTHDDFSMVYHEKEFAAVKVTTEDKHQYEIILSKKGKRTSINQVEKKKMSTYIGNLKTVMFAPEDLNLIKGSPLDRRYFIDLELMQLNKAYLTDLNLYKKILKQRNALLKQIKLDDDYTFLDILGMQLYDVGVRIMDYREAFIKSINENMRPYFEVYKDFLVEITYEPHADRETFLKAIKLKQKQDILYQQTLTGPHKDDLRFKLNGLEAKTYASQGQQRLLVIILKLALLDVIKKQTNVDVVLLLDDVFSELDLEKQQMFINHLSVNHQVLITTAVPLIFKNENIEILTLKKE